MFERAAQCATAAESNVLAEDSVPAPAENLKRKLLAWKSASTGSVSAQLLHGACTNLYAKADAVIQTDVTSEDDFVKPHTVVPSVFITEQQRDRLKAPSLRSAAELRSLVSYVNDASTSVPQFSFLNDSRQVSSPHQTLDISDVANASGVTRELAEMIRRVRSSMNVPNRSTARSLVL